MIPMRGPPAEPPASRLSYINDILCDEEICEVIREDERSRVPRNSAKPLQNNTVHVRQVRFGGGNGRVSSCGSLGLRKHFATANPSLLSRDQLTSPTPSVHFQIHPAPRSSPKKRYVHSNITQCLPYRIGLIRMKHSYACRGSSSRNLKSAMSSILRQTSVGSLHNNQVNPTSPPQQQQNRPPSRPPSRPPLKLYVSAAGRMSPPPSAMSPFPLTPLIAEVEQEKLAGNGGNNLSDLVKGQCLTPLKDFLSTI